MLTERKRVCILVKAYPQPSKKYGETVCCAGVTPGGEFIRLYPIPYRQLNPDQKFDRYDTIEVETHRDDSYDSRPESFHVLPDTLKVIQRGSKLSREQRVQLWLPHISASVTKLKDENQATGRSLGIVRPIPGSVRFSHRQVRADEREELELAGSVAKQMSMFDIDPLRTADVAPEYWFSYAFDCADAAHDMKIHDWEVQAAYFNFKRKHGDAALTKLHEQYGTVLPSQNLHVILGTIHGRPYQFIVIGLLRSTAALDEVAKQQRLL